MMRVHEPGQDQTAADVDDLVIRSRSARSRPDGVDAAVDEPHMARLEHPSLRVHRDDAAVRDVLHSHLRTSDGRC